MSDDQKRAELNSTFPVEYPVMAGEVVSVETPSANELRYVLLIPTPVDTVSNWYRTTLNERVFISQSETPTENGGVTMVFGRAEATYTIAVEPTIEGSRVLGTLAFADFSTPAP